MTTDGIHRINLVQAICLRPRMYTENGTLTEVYDLLTGADARQPIAGNRANASIVATVQWLRENATDPTRVDDELLQLRGTNDAALTTICEFASTLPPE